MSVGRCLARLAQRLLFFGYQGQSAMVVSVKYNYRKAVRLNSKPQKQRKPGKVSSSQSIAQRYFELRRLREQILEAESRIGPR